MWKVYKFVPLVELHPDEDAMIVFSLVIFNHRPDHSPKPNISICASWHGLEPYILSVPVVHAHACTCIVRISTHKHARICFSTFTRILTYPYKLATYTLTIRYLRRFWGPAVARRFECTPNGAHKADLWRYAILYERGGVYVAPPASSWIFVLL